MTKGVVTRVLPINEATIAEAARLILEGMPVAAPTETVYGLAADATNGSAVAAIYQAKQRPSFNPLIVHVPDIGEAERYAEFGALARQLSERFWPGPLTLVLPLRVPGQIASLASAGLPTIAVRCPAHPVMQALLEATAVPLAAPSANASGRVSPTRAEHVRASLDGRIPLILDGGPTSVGIESTIIGISGDRARLLRPGPITLELLGMEVEQADGTVEAPGQLESHYAPSKPVRLNALTAKEGEWLIGFGPVAGHSSLSSSGDLVEAAARLFDLLHEAEGKTENAIAIAPIPIQGLGLAINDRLRRASATRT